MTTAPATVAIIGRPNVGKSSLFNRIIGRRISIVHSDSGVTRDRIILPTTWENKHFLLVDTGGLGVLSKEKNVERFDELIRKQVHAVIEDAQHLIWVVDALDGIAPLDQEIADLLRTYAGNVTIAINKADNQVISRAACSEFSALGFARLQPISCSHNLGVDELLDAVAASLPDSAAACAAEAQSLRVAVVGRPNAGKSSLINSILGEDRVMACEIAGTTRDAVDVPLTVQTSANDSVPLTLIDTAGLRQRRRIDSAVELYSMMRAENAIRRCDIAVLVIDATDPGTAQDRRIGRAIVDAGKPCILAVNKWDLVAHGMKMQDLRNLVMATMPFMHFAKVVCVSAVQNENTDKLLRDILFIREQMKIMVPTSVLNRYIQDLTERTPSPMGPNNKRFKIYYGTMISTPPPHIALYVNHSRYCPPQYKQFLENQLRQTFFADSGLPIRLDLRSKPRQEELQSQGRRQSAAGKMRQRAAVQNANTRHRERKKRWRRK